MQLIDSDPKTKFPSPTDYVSLNINVWHIAINKWQTDVIEFIHWTTD